jgi:6-phosphogluconolactonase (cycloisomerase 2 family)
MNSRFHVSKARSRCAHWVSSAAVVLAITSLLWSQQEESPAAREARIDRLILQLDDDKFEVREKAEAELADVGEAALPKLLLAVKDTAAERRERAAKLLRQIREQGVGLQFMSAVKRDDLSNANSAAISPDGRFLYVSASSGQTASVYRFDAVTSRLEHVQSITDARDLIGLSALRLSPDARLVVGACGFGMCVVLFERDAEKGTLSICDVVRTDPSQGFALQRQSDAMFSPDGRFVYSLDRTGSVVVFEVKPDHKLRYVQTFTGDGQSLLNASGIAFHPSGSPVFVAGADSSALNVMRRDATTGKLDLIQVLYDDQNGITAFARVYGVCTNPDGRFVYTCSNRDHSVSAFRLEPDGKLSLLQEFINDESDLKGFIRGNEIIVTPDGLSLFASGSESHSLACFDVDPKSGKLTYRATVRNEGTMAPAGDGATGLAVTPDGSHVFVTLSSASAVSVFKRSVKESPLNK